MAIKPTPRPAVTPEAVASLTPEQQAILLDMQANMSGSDRSAPKVYLGTGRPVLDDSAAGLDIQPGRNFPRGKERDQTEDINQAFRRFYAMDEEQLGEFQRKAFKAGFYGSKEPRYGDWDEDSAKVYGLLVERAASFYDAGKKLTVDDVLDMAVQSGPSAEELLQDGPFTGTKSRTDRDVKITDPQSARAGLLGYLRDELGRAPSEQESRAFVRALQAAQRANPKSTTTTGTFVEGEQTDSSSVWQGGLDPAAFMTEHVENDPALATERNTFRVATDYYNAAMSVLGEGGL
jgi:hypothetical protein